MDRVDFSFDVHQFINFTLTCQVIIAIFYRIDGNNAYFRIFLSNFKNAKKYCRYIFDKKSLVIWSQHTNKAYIDAILSYYNMITSDDILGKDAIDPDGSILGTVIKLHIDHKNMEIMGITVDMGLLKPDLYIGRDNISFFGIDAVLLKSVPYDKYKGLAVIDSHGKEIGTVFKVIVEEGDVKEIIVSHRLGKKMEIPFKDVKEVGESVVLKD